jgi:hypothetical protein
MSQKGKFVTTKSWRITYYCDYCKKKINGSVPVGISFNYGSIRDGDLMQFCTDKCFISWCKRIK